MKYRKRTIYTEADKALMWDRWERGESLHSIAQLFDVDWPGTIRIGLSHLSPQQISESRKGFRRDQKTQQFFLGQ